MSYSALVTKIESIEPIPGADKIVLAKVGGYSVIVGRETNVGDAVVFFDQGGQLSPEFCEVNDLLRDRADGSKGNGYFEPNRRVRAIKMRGVKSEGFICPLSHFDYTGFDSDILVEGFQFTELADHEICCKYETPSTKKAREQKQKNVRRGETDMMRKQFDISPFRVMAAHIPNRSMIYITEKLHGTSHRIGYVLEDRKLRPWDYIKYFLGIHVEFEEWKILNGSKNVILESAQAREITSYYGDDNFRYRAVDGIEPALGETIYGEIIGWHREPEEDDGVVLDECDGMIMPTPDTSILLDVQRKFGNRMAYKYGLKPGECKFVVYRITMANEDGHIVELSWPQVVRRCEELGLPHVPELTSFYYDEDSDEQNCYTTPFDYLISVTDELVNGVGGDQALPSVLDPSHIREGVVVRWEGNNGFGWAKHKSVVFGMLEGYIKDRDDYVDLEEIS